jgi:hypothetical protein
MLKKFNLDEDDKFFKVYSPRESYQELSLLFNDPCSASILANDQCIMSALEKECLNNIVKEAAMKKRENYEMFLKSVDIFKVVQEYQLSQICDALQFKKIAKGTEIINQNESGNTFQTIEEGEPYDMKTFKPGEEPILVKEYQKGNYF